MKHSFFYTGSNVVQITTCQFQPVFAPPMSATVGAVLESFSKLASSPKVSTICWLCCAEFKTRPLWTANAHWVQRSGHAEKTNEDSDVSPAKSGSRRTLPLYRLFPGAARRRRSFSCFLFYLWHLWPEIDLLQVDGLWSQVVEQVAQKDPVAEGLRQVEYLRGLPCHPVVRR